MKRLVFIAIAQTLTALAAAASGANEVTTQGLGPITFGMTVAQFSNALHERKSVPKDPEDRGCFYLESDKFPGVAFMFENEKLRRIDVRTNKVPTQDGIRVGTRVDQLKQRYGTRMTDEPHHYSGPEDRYLTLNLSPTMAVRFETNAGNIDNFYVGYKTQVQYVEGCS